MPFRLPADPMCGPAHWNSHVNATLWSRKLDQKSVMERRARTPYVPAPPPHIPRVVKSLMFCSRALLDGWQPRRNCLDIRQAGDARLSLNTKRVTQRLVISQICLHLLHGLTSLPTMASLVFWVHTAANSANVNDCCSGVCSSASSSMDVNGDASHLC